MPKFKIGDTVFITQKNETFGWHPDMDSFLNDGIPKKITKLFSYRHLQGYCLNTTGRYIWLEACLSIHTYKPSQASINELGPDFDPEPVKKFSPEPANLALKRSLRRLLHGGF